jgi:Predicted pyridoxal phosphate-dependent enzyme apparently involved in regulation of cell wall biogenesis
LEEFLLAQTFQKDNFCYDKTTLRHISACVPMHTFGHPVDIIKIKAICDEFNILVVEDAAESLGSYFGATHTGLFGTLGILSFNGNKTITTGGGGMIITNNVELAKRAKHISTTAKVPHAWDFFHDEVGFNFRLPNLNAALGCAQMERLPEFLENKRDLALQYQKLFNSIGIEFIEERQGTTSNFWLNCIVLKDRKERDQFLQYTNNRGVMTRPIWTLMNKLPMYSHCPATSLENAQWFEDRVVNIPSSPKV